VTAKSTFERPALTTTDLRQGVHTMSSPVGRANTNYNIDTSGKVTNLAGWGGRSGIILFLNHNLFIF